MSQELADPGKQDRVAHGVPVVAAFDGYRAFAVMGIVLFHLLGGSGLLQRAEDTWVGQAVWGTIPYSVAVFFIVSGFVLYLPTVARKGDFEGAKSFWIRRAARLYPGLWVALVIVLLLIAVLPQSSLANPVEMPGPVELLVNFGGLSGFLSLFDPGNAPGFGVDTPLWTLTIELVFYVVLPLVAATYFRRPLVGLAVAAAISILWREAFAHIYDIAEFLSLDVSPLRLLQLQFANNQAPHWAFSFAAGMTMAWAFVRIRERKDQEAVARAAPYVAGAGLAAICVCAYFAGRYAIDTPPASVLFLAFGDSSNVIGYTIALSVFMLALVFCTERVQRPFTNVWARRVADISYPIYLSHAVVIWVITANFAVPADGSISSFLIIAAAVLPISFGYGYLSTRFVELPARRWGQRYGRREQARRAAERPPAKEPTTASPAG